jgi:hypothetical protein
MRQKQSPDTSRLWGWQHESGPCPRRIFRRDLQRHDSHLADKALDMRRGKTPFPIIEGEPIRLTTTELHIASREQEFD